MCTAIAKKGKDLIYGFNLDIDPTVWDFRLLKTKRYFSVGITVGHTTYLTHGVNCSGQFGNVPYMNGETFGVPKGKKRMRIDILNDRYIRGRYSMEDIRRIVNEYAVVNAPAVNMHSLLGSGEGELMMIEPGYGVREIEENHAVISNFPVMAELNDYGNPFFGKDRYDRAETVLKNSGGGFSVSDALELLDEVKQRGQWGTKISFVYSGNENAVYYCLNGEFDDIRIHRF